MPLSTCSICGDIFVQSEPDEDDICYDCAEDLDAEEEDEDDSDEERDDED